MTRFSSFLAACALACVCFVGGLSIASADTLDIDPTPRSGTNGRQSYIEDFRSFFSDQYFSIAATGEQGATMLMLRIARDMKNTFVVITTVFLLAYTLVLFFTNGTEKDMSKWRQAIIWATVGILVMQSAYAFVYAIYGEDIGAHGGSSAVRFLNAVMFPLIHLMETLASFLFLGMAFYAFFKIVTAGGDDEKAKRGKNEVIYAIIGFIVIKLASKIVTTIYGDVNRDCAGHLFSTSVCTLQNPNLTDTVRLMTTLLNYFNGFMAIIIMVLVIYAGWSVLVSEGADDKMKKAKNILKYIVFGLMMLVASYAILNFYLLKNT